MKMLPDLEISIFLDIVKILGLFILLNGHLFLLICCAFKSEVFGLCRKGQIDINNR